MNNMIEIYNVTKQYRLGAIGGTTLRAEIQSKIARLRGKEDPNSKLDAKQVGGNIGAAINGGFQAALHI